MVISAPLMQGNSILEVVISVSLIQGNNFLGLRSGQVFHEYKVTIS